jgi:catechol 2,3-dioxygenase
MSAALISTLRSVEMGLPDVAAAEKFYTETWHLAVAAREGDSVYLRGTGADCYLVALHKTAKPELLSVTFRAPSAQALDGLAEKATAAGGTVLSRRAAVKEYGGGEAIVLRDPQGRILRFVTGDARHADAGETRDKPVRLAHAVMNSQKVADAQPFYEALGFKLSDRTRIMAFMRIPMVPRGDHHSIALADADNNCLNHVAFVMPDIDSVMRGGGRLKDAGYSIEWGPGRHGPGDNAFNYFVGPAGFVIEYTAEVEQVDDSYEVGSPEDWKWPPGRVDHWGISQPPSARLKEAQREIHFADGWRG